MVSTLYIVPLSRDPADLTLRARRILRATLTACDFTLDDDLAPRMIPTAQALAALEQEAVALVTLDNPPINDHAAIIQAAIQRGARIEPIPGGADAITALVLSGLPTDQFVVYADAADLPETLARDPFTVVIGVRDLADALPRLIAQFGADRSACVVFGAAVYRGDFASAPHDHAQAAFVVLAGAEPTSTVWDETRVIAALRDQLDAGASVKDAAKALASASGWSRGDLYQRALALRDV